MKRALPISGQLKFVGLMQTIRNRHLAEWRFPLFTQIVMVNIPIWNVSVMGTMLTPFQECSQPPTVMAMLFPAPYGVGIILSENEKNVKYVYDSRKNYHKNCRSGEGTRKAGKKMRRNKVSRRRRHGSVKTTGEAGGLHRPYKGLIQQRLKTHERFANRK